MQISETERGWITWRSMLIGSLGAAGLCALVPYNDYVVANTFLVGGYMPPIVVLSLLVLTCLINAPLHRWFPHLALSRGELGTILAMLLAACAIPSQGLMRAMLPTMAWPFHFGESDSKWWSAFTSMALPGYLFPTGRSTGDPNDPITRYFYDHIPTGSAFAIPYAAWIKPIFVWGIFFGALIATLVSLAVLVLPQWAMNERLPFPLAQVQVALIDAPKRGRAFNEILGSRLFWFAILVTFVIQSLINLNGYFPRVPVIPIGYDLNKVLGSEPWAALSSGIKKNQIFFTFVGVAYFIQARMSFSLWFIFIVEQMLQIWLHRMQIESVGQGVFDQHLGACFAYIAGAIWIGRQHWARVIRSAFSRKGLPEGVERFATARLALGVAVLGICIMTVWLILLGVTPWVAAMAIAFILLGHAVTARLVCETGLPYFRAIISPMQICKSSPVGWYSTKDIFFAGVLDTNGPFTARESAMTFSLLALKDNDTDELPKKAGRKLLALMAWAMVLGFAVSAWSSLHCYYTYATPLSVNVGGIINPHARSLQPKLAVVDPVLQQVDGHWPQIARNTWLHMGAGAIITIALQIGALTWANWPLMPVGYVASQSFYIPTAWFSIFLGWLAKVLIVQFGGIQLYLKLRPIFIGMICGESLSTGVWLVINLVLASTGHDYKVIFFLPN